MKVLLSISLLLTSIVILVVTDQYLFCPVYSFTGFSSFNGDSIYNPYAYSLPKDWVKCNFHAHAHCWDGLTDGHGTASDINNIYQKLDYGVHPVSNYQLIDTTYHTQPNYISAYEHGCNLKKNHQLVLGADRVSWKDYYLPQTLSNKQNILNDLSATDTGSLYIINHPMLRNGYCASDFTRLTNYSCMEVLNPSCNSAILWDAALSVGKPIFIVGDDDIHKVSDTNKVGRICTWINVPAVNRANIIQALKTGCSYAMTVGVGTRRQVRLGNYDSLPGLKTFTVNGDQVSVRFSLPAQSIIISGQNGLVLDSTENTDTLDYKMTAQQSYTRVVASYGNGTQLYLNPVFRYSKVPLKQSVASINSVQTLLFRTLGIIILLFWFRLVFRLVSPARFRKISLQIIYKRKYGFESDNTPPKGFQIWNRWPVRYVHRFFNNLAVQRKG